MATLKAQSSPAREGKRPSERALQPSDVGSLPENRGLDCNLGIDFVPGHPQRMLTAGVVNSVDAKPARTTYARQWIYVYDQQHQQEVLQEINPRRPRVHIHRFVLSYSATSGLTYLLSLPA